MHFISRKLVSVNNSVIDFSSLTFRRAIGCGITRMVLFGEILGPSCKYVFWESGGK